MVSEAEEVFSRIRDEAHESERRAFEQICTELNGGFLRPGVPHDELPEISPEGVTRMLEFAATCRWGTGKWAVKFIHWAAQGDRLGAEARRAAVRGLIGLALYQEPEDYPKKRCDPNVLRAEILEEYFAAVKVWRLANLERHEENSERFERSRNAREALGVMGREGRIALPFLLDVLLDRVHDKSYCFDSFESLLFANRDLLKVIRDRLAEIVEGEDIEANVESEHDDVGTDSG